MCNIPSLMYQPTSSYIRGIKGILPASFACGVASCWMPCSLLMQHPLQSFLVVDVSSDYWSENIADELSL